MAEQTGRPWTSPSGTPRRRPPAPPSRPPLRRPDREPVSDTPPEKPRPLSSVSTRGLLRRLSRYQEELRSRGLPAEALGVASCYALELAIHLMDLVPAPPAEAGYEARSPDGIRYRIRGWRVGDESSSRPLSVTPGLPHRAFDAALLILLDPDFRIARAVIASVESLLHRARYRARTNDWVLDPDSGFWTHPRTEVRTREFRTLARTLDARPLRRSAH